MVIIPAIPATLKAPCHVTNAAHPPTCHLHRGDQVFHSWFSTIHTMCFFLTVFFSNICYCTVLHICLHRDIDTELQRHFLQRPSFMGPLIFLSQRENPAGFGWWNCCRLVVIGFIGSSWSEDDALDSLEIWRLGYPLVMTGTVCHGIDDPLK